MTLHWWHHWFWITGQAPVVLMLLMVLPRCACDEDSLVSRRLLGFAGPAPAPAPVTYLTTAALPEHAPREPKAIGLAAPTHPAVSSTTAPSPPPPDGPEHSPSPSPGATSSPSAIVEIVEDVEEEVRSNNGSQLMETSAAAEEEVVAAELLTTPSAQYESPSPINASLTPLADTSEEMVNDEPVRAVSEHPAVSPTTPATSSSTLEVASSATSLMTNASSLIPPASTGRLSTLLADAVPVHPGVVVATTPLPSSDANMTTTSSRTNSSSSSSSTAPREHQAAHAREHKHEESEVGRTAAVAPLGVVAPYRPHSHSVGLDAGSITGIVLGIVVFSGLVGTISFVLYRRRYLNKPQTLNDKCSNPDSSGYIDDSTLRENSEEMYSLDNDSFLNSLEAMTIQNYWTDSVKHTKL